MIVIHKFQLELEDSFTVPMEAGAKILRIAMQNGTPTLWAIVDTDAPMHDHAFQCRGTGHNLGPVGTYVGTLDYHGGLVFHIFEGEAGD